MTRSPRAVRRVLEGVYASAIAALDPARIVRTALRAPALRPLLREADRRGLLVVGAGKGAATLAAACEAVLGSRVQGGLVVVPAGYERTLARIRVAVGSHPLPDRRSVAATRRLVGLVTAPVHADRPVLVLVTGGASSLLAAPVPGLTLADERRTHALLLASGASIREMNLVRRHLSTVKGGGLAALLAGRRAVALVVSDVPDDDPAVVGSGPTIAGAGSAHDALAVLRRHGLLARVPIRVRHHLARVARRPAPRRHAAPAMPTLLVASNRMARLAAARVARRAGFSPVVVAPTPLVGPTASASCVVARTLARLRVRARRAMPVMWIAGGETTVALGPRPGKGGRNQELALATARALGPNVTFALLAAGTDGVDGPTDAAGAITDTATLVRAGAAAVDAALARHDVHPLLARVGALFRPGPTGTNVADLTVGLVWKGRGWRLPGRVVQGPP